MSDVQRICAQCSTASPLDARYCTRCGYDFQAELPVQQSNLPVVIGKAALPVLVGAASLALRAGWRLLQSRMAQEAARKAFDSTFNRPVNPPVEPAKTPAPRQEEVTTPRQPRRSIHIRSSWAVGDANGVWQQGHSEHTINFDD
jgi:hypothetical protein